MTLHLRLTLVLVALCMVTLNSQDTTYFDHASHPVTTRDSAWYMRITTRDAADTNHVREVETFISGGVKTKTNYSCYSKHQLDGPQEEWFEGGQQRRMEEYAKGNRSGKLLTFWSNGLPKRNDEYVADTFKQGTCYNEKGELIPHFDYWIDPSFIGGFDSLRAFVGRNLVYPAKALHSSIEGKVMVRFFVKANGRITRTFVVDPINPILDEEAERLVRSMPLWQPARQDGDVIDCWITLPVVFKLR